LAAHAGESAGGDYVVIGMMGFERNERQRRTTTTTKNEDVEEAEGERRR